MKSLEESTIVVCSIVRDAASGLRNNIPVVSDFCHCCKDYRVVVFENDSKDGTKELLKAWQMEDPERIEVFCADTKCSKPIPAAKEVSVNPFFSRRRIEVMTRLRNQYMEHIWNKDLDVDYLVVVDLDVDQIDLDGILSSFQTDRVWDAVTAFGYSTSPMLKRRYHDTYALTLWDDRYAPQTEAKITANADRLGDLKPIDDWIRVYSAFGGLAIYRYEAVKGLYYQVIDNADSRVEVRCEHFSLYQQMTTRGFCSFYINPAMQLHYQKLTLDIIFKSLKRRLVRGLVPFWR